MTGDLFYSQDNLMRDVLFCLPTDLKKTKVPLRSRAAMRGVTPHPRSGAVAGRSYPTSKEPWMCGRRRA